MKLAAHFSTESIDFTVTNDGKWKEAAGNVAVGIIVGALTGLLIGACSKNTDTLASTAISAGAGLAASAIQTGVEKGVDAEIPVYKCRMRPANKSQALN